MRAVGEGYDIHAVRLLFVFGLHEDDEGCVAPSTCIKSVYVSYVVRIETLLTGEFCYLADAVLVAFEIR